MAGDTNDLKLGPILIINANLKSIVGTTTRINPDNPSKIRILDNIITDLHSYYQEPKCLAPIDPDREDGKPSDHLTVTCEPRNAINNITNRQKRTITLRPIMESGLTRFGEWIKNETWEKNIETQAVDTKVEMLFKSVTSKVNECFPEKTLKFTSDDSPWVNEKVKKLRRLKGR